MKSHAWKHSHPPNPYQQNVSLLEYGLYRGFLAGLSFHVLLFSGWGHSFSEEDEGHENRAPGFQQIDRAADQPRRL